MTTKAKKIKESSPEFDYTTIKTFEDACKKVNTDPAKLPDVSGILEEFAKPIIAAYKLLIIYKAINNEWKPDWSNWDQYKYYPWFEVLSSGFGFSCSSYYYDDAGTTVGSRLCFESEEKAKYAGNQFLQLYKDFLTITK
jgi:hypothetical protein